MGKPMTEQTQTPETQSSPSSDVGKSDIIRVEGMHKWYGDFHVLQDLNLTVRHGERIVICGPSGSGKSTFIRCINRLEEHQQGKIIVDDVELTDDVRQIEASGERLAWCFSISTCSRI
jgi:general L-amino acid transport system ATP-binding protein